MVTGGTWTKDTLTAALKKHITNAVTHYKGQCYAWDVVDEALNDDGTFREVSSTPQSANPTSKSPSKRQRLLTLM
jgi:GH35 family endo-1,4-beta-xylanase